MRYWTTSAINTSQKESAELYLKLANYEPDEKLSRDDIGQLLFILRHYADELECILHDREKAVKLSK